MKYYCSYSKQEDKGLITNRYDLDFLEFYKGPEMPCLRIIRKCININTAVRRGNTKVCKL